MNMHMEVSQLRQTIAALIAEFPELAEDDTLRADMLDGETSVDTVLCRLVDASQNAKAMTAAVKSRMDDLAVRKARYERQEEAFRRLIQQVLDQASLRSWTLPEATLSLSWRKPAPFVSNEDALPDELCKFVRKPAMAAIKAAVEKNGVLPSGVSMSNGKVILTILPR